MAYLTPACTNCFKIESSGTPADPEISMPLRRIDGIIWPIVLGASPPTHKVPSGPLATMKGVFVIGVTCELPDTVIRPIPENPLIYHNAPSGPCVMSSGSPPAEYSVTCPTEGQSGNMTRAQNRASWPVKT